MKRDKTQTISELIASIHREALPSRWLEEAHAAVNEQVAMDGRNAFSNSVATRLDHAGFELTLSVPKSESAPGYDAGSYMVREGGVTFAATGKGARKLSDHAAVMTEEMFREHLRQAVRKML